ncbi:hypothetical protein ACBG90_08585, partial [Stutzerimonas kunmingensis]|uniref:hypothetical protein n=1 Tax=Stutzerimonas kunmingensis TaxID=1211807 RepID=UPI00352593B2
EQRKALIAVGRRKNLFKNNTIGAQCPAWGARGRVFESLRPDQYTKIQSPRGDWIFLWPLRTEQHEDSVSPLPPQHRHRRIPEPIQIDYFLST